jgi:hypothetical protein
MSRQSNAQRLPTPPVLKGGIVNHDADMKAMNEHLGTMTTILNQAVQSLQNRLNTVQQVGAISPPPVSGLSVTGKQGLFHITWNRIKNADGYVVTQASDSSMTQLVGRYNIPDANQCVHQVPVGNVAVTNYFQVYAYQGPKYSDPSPAVKGLSVVYGSTESAPPAPPIAPLQPKLAPIRSGPNLV